MAILLVLLSVNTFAVFHSYGQQTAAQEYSVTYSTGSSVKYTFYYPTQVLPGTTFSITVVAVHVPGSAGAANLQLQFAPTPSGWIAIAEVSNVISFGGLAGGAQARADFRFTVSASAPPWQKLQIRTDTWDALSSRQALSPDIQVTVGWDWVLISAIALVVVLVVVGITAVFLLTRRKPSPPAVPYKPISPPPQPVTLKPAPPQAIKPGAHVPRVVGRRQEKK